jgi:hypothetical protein
MCSSEGFAVTTIGLGAAAVLRRSMAERAAAGGVSAR